MTMNHQPQPQEDASAAAPKPLSKRQRRALGSHPSTKWQQQPRIRSAGARARAYLAHAGLADDDPPQDGQGKQKRRGDDAGKGASEESGGGGKRKAIDLLDPKLDLHSPEVKFGRLLGGTDQRSRHGAVKMLREYLKARSDIGTGRGLSELDLLKLWKGLWYTLYMADKVPVQDKLSQILAELMWCLAGTEENDLIAGEEYLRVVDEELEEEEGLEGDAGDVLAVNVFDDEFGEEEDEDGDTMRIVEVLEDGSDDEESDRDDEGGMQEENIESEEEEEEVDDEERRIQDMHEPHCRGAHLASLFVSTFLCTVRREWGNVDKHRVDKFYTAVRCMIGEVYKYMAKRHWNLGIVRLFNDVLYAEGLSADAPGLTNGLRYHLVDICVDELAKANREAATPLTEATFLDCLEPFFGLAGNAEDKNVQRRAMEKVLDKFLNEYSVVSPVAIAEDEEGELEEEKALVFSDVHVGTVAQFLFDMAGDADTDERFRRSLFEMHKAYVRQIRAAGREVDLEGHVEEDDVDEDEDEMADGEKDAGEESRENANVGTTAGAAREDVTSAVEKYEPKKKQKRKKGKSKGDKEGAKDEINAPETPKWEEKNSDATATTPKTKSSKKKRKKRDAGSAETAFEEPSAAKTPTPQPKKKKQKSPPSVDPRAMHSPDQVVDSPTHSDDEGAAAEASASKRVSFGTMNHCKSYKASMKAMRSLDKERWDTKCRTPDKSILREKGAALAGTGGKNKKRSGKKKGRKST